MLLSEYDKVVEATIRFEMKAAPFQVFTASAAETMKGRKTYLRVGDVAYNRLYSATIEDVEVAGDGSSVTVTATIGKH